MKYFVTAISDVNKRENNEDSFYFDCIRRDDEKYVIALVADGMGGLDDGEIASKIVKNEIRDFIDNEEINEEGLERKIEEAILRADSKIRKISDENDSALGTTITMLVLKPDRNFLTVNVGDSRIYKFKDKKIEALTKDQTVYQREKDTGEIIDGSMSEKEKRNTLVQCIGSGIEPKPIFTRGVYMESESFLLCSDGLYNRITEREFLSFYDGCRSPKEFLEGLKALAKEKGERDNITGILIDVLFS